MCHFLQSVVKKKVHDFFNPAMSDRESSLRESVSGASFSRVSLTLATGYQQQLSQAEREGSEVAEDGEKRVGGGSEEKESEGRKKDEQEVDVHVLAEPKPWNGVSGKSPSHASCEGLCTYILQVWVGNNEMLPFTCMVYSFAISKQ